MAATAASPSLLRLQVSKRNSTLGFVAPLSRSFVCTAKGPSHPNDDKATGYSETTAVSNAEAAAKISRWFSSPEYRSWKDKEVSRNIEPITLLTKEILHSQRYMDGECLTAEDEKAVVDKLLRYHPHSDNKIGSGLNAIMKLTAAVGLVKPTVRPAICAPPTTCLHRRSGLHTTTASATNDVGEADHKLVLNLPAPDSTDHKSPKVDASGAKKKTDHTPREANNGEPQRSWKSIEAEILQDIEPLVQRVKYILHPGRYMDGERLTRKDEKTVMEKLLKYHHGYQKKIGSGFHYIKVDRQEEFVAYTRCMFVVRTDGSCVDFSYKKCLFGYVKEKYPRYVQLFAMVYNRLVRDSNSKTTDKKKRIGNKHLVKDSNSKTTSKKNWRE